MKSLTVFTLALVAVTEGAVVPKSHLAKGDSDVRVGKPSCGWWSPCKNDTHIESRPVSEKRGLWQRWENSWQAEDCDDPKPTWSPKEYKDPGQAYGYPQPYSSTKTHGYSQPPGYSTPTGYYSTPTGYYSTPTGYYSTPTGYYSTPTGYYSKPVEYYHAPSGYNGVPQSYQAPKYTNTSSPVAPTPYPAGNGMPECWSTCFAKYDNPSETELCGNGEVQACICDTCSTADDEAYKSWKQGYCAAPTIPMTYTSPAAPTYTSPEDPSYPSPEDPSYPSPEDPSYTSPEAPTYTSPEDPSYTSPEAPTYTSPEDPTYASPTAPAAYYHPDPVAPTGYPSSSASAPIFPSPSVDPSSSVWPSSSSVWPSSSSFWPSSSSVWPSSSCSSSAIEPRATL